MPGGDGTGPMGQGSMTGRAAGFCVGYSTPGYANPVSGRGFGYGRGFGFGRGWGRGRGRGFGWGIIPPQQVAPQQEADMLKDEAKAMQNEMKAINERIKELESAAKKEKK